MSKVKPEAGDIWKSKESGTVFILTRKDDYFKDWFHSMASDGRTRKIIIDNRFFGLSEYLGKSKENIDDLFKTENEE